MNVRPAPVPCCPACGAAYAALTPKCWLCSRPIPERVLCKGPPRADVPATIPRTPRPGEPAPAEAPGEGPAGAARPARGRLRSSTAAEEAARRDLDLAWPVVLLVALAVVVEAFRYGLDWGIVALIVAAPAGLFLMVGVDEEASDEDSLQATLNRLVRGAGYFFAVLGVVLLAAVGAVIGLFITCWVALVALAR